MLMKMVYPVRAIMSSKLAAATTVVGISAHGRVRTVRSVHVRQKEGCASIQVRSTLRGQHVQDGGTARPCYGRVVSRRPAETDRRRVVRADVGDAPLAVPSRFSCTSNMS